MRLLGQIFLSLGILCAALVLGVMLLERLNDCTMNWYGYDCPEYYRWAAALAPMALIIAPLAMVLGGVMLWSARRKG